MLKLEYINPYFPYGLSCLVTDQGVSKISKLEGLYSDSSCVFHDLVESMQGFDEVKPILRPLSDLTEEIEVNGEKFVPIYWLEDKYYTMPILQDINRFNRLLEEDENWIYQISFILITHLFEWHFDVFGLIEKGLAINSNSLSEV